MPPDLRPKTSPASREITSRRMFRGLSWDMNNLRVAGVLNYIGVDYTDVNVLADDAMRQGIKDYSDWPTVPQLYVKGEFVGGCDIITEMTLSGELDEMFVKEGVSFDKDAADKIREANA